MILNGVIALCFAFFAEFVALLANYVTVEDSCNVRKILSSGLPLLAITKPPCSAVSLRQLSYLLGSEC